MKITVITVCYQSAATLADCIQSVAGQEYENLEHWLIDGASTDGSQDLIQSLEHDRLRWISEPDEGLYHAMNKGLGRATGDIVGFLNADDVFDHPTVLQEVAEAFAEPEVQAAYADLCYVDPEDFSKVQRYWRAEPFEPGMFRRGWMPPHPTFYARKSVYEEHGNFDTHYRFGADWDLLMRLFEKAKIETRYVPSTWVRMRTGGVTNRSLKNVLRNNWECLRAFSRNGLSPEPLFLVHKLTHRLKQFVAREN